ncbi:MAG: BppU family phage baseplate upper protein [Ruminiclostridium sp.]|nr:BppU family phage baseplate upper protein [Ruminiclostridium sp.]
MITHNNNIILDLSCLSPAPTIAVKQDDKQSRTITASFTDGGEAVSLSGIASAELRCLRPDGKMTVTAAEISGNTVKAVIPDNALAVAGRGYGDILLIGSNGEVISAARFILQIKPGAVSDLSISSTSDFALYREEIAEIDSRLSVFRSEYASQMANLYSKLGKLTQQLGGASIKICTAEEYSALTPDPNTVYYVVDGDKITQYLGTAKLTSGSAPAAAVLSADGLIGAFGNATKVEEEN